tara:strand:+ start:433 stop:1185 length:753 start_codon:yes stop_codon:yes gene_type:complete
MKNILLGFLVFGLFILAGCRKEDTGSGTQYGDGVNDIDGNAYESVIIGDQEWMAENLRTTKYNDGSLIPNVKEDKQWVELETGAWCHYNNDSRNEGAYGKLYNWYAAENENLCPVGWHVPTDDEWRILRNYLTANGYAENEGKVLKSTSGWKRRNITSTGIGTDYYGWNGLPGGIRSYVDGRFYAIPGSLVKNESKVGKYGYYGSWLSSTNTGSWIISGYCYSLSKYSDSLSSGSGGERESGFSVRCLRD